MMPGALTCRESLPSQSLSAQAVCLNFSSRGLRVTEAWLDSKVQAHSKWAPLGLSLANTLAQSPSSSILQVCGQLSQDADHGAHVVILEEHLGYSSEPILEAVLKGCPAPSNPPLSVFSRGLCPVWIPATQAHPYTAAD